MSLAAAIITVVGVDLVVLALLAYVMRAPFRLTCTPVAARTAERLG